jgi:hypothetical protein
VLTIESIRVHRYVGSVVATGRALDGEVLLRALPQLQAQAAALGGDTVIGLRLTLDGRSPHAYVAVGTAVVRDR